MANTQAMCTSFKKEILNGEHQFGSPTLVSRVSLTAPTTDSFKAALYLTTSSKGAGTTVYSIGTPGTDELAASGNYTQGGIGVPAFAAPSTTGTTAFTTPGGSLGWSNLTSSGAFDTVLIYNSTQGNKAVSVHTFGSQTISAGTLTLTMPTNDSTSALLRLA